MKQKKKHERTRREKSFLNIDIKSLIEKCLELLFKTFRTSFTGESPFLLEHINSLRVLFIAIILCLLQQLSQNEPLINVFRWLKFHSKTFSNPFFHRLPSASTTAESHYKYLLRAMKTQSKAQKERETCFALTKWKLKLVRKNKYMIIVFFSAFSRE